MTLVDLCRGQWMFDVEVTLLRTVWAWWRMRPSISSYHNQRVLSSRGGRNTAVIVSTVLFCVSWWPRRAKRLAISQQIAQPTHRHGAADITDITVFLFEVANSINSKSTSKLRHVMSHYCSCILWHWASKPNLYFKWKFQLILCTTRQFNNSNNSNIESFYAKKLCSRFVKIEVQFFSQKWTSSL